VISDSAGTPQEVYAADLDGDGDKDVLMASFSDDKIAWYENQGSGKFGQQQLITTKADGAESVFATDLDGDGDPDVLSASAIDEKIAWYENQGNGNFGPQDTISLKADEAQSVYATDLDGDGDADILSASEIGDKISWYENLSPTNRTQDFSKEKQSLHLYPNPTTGELNLSGDWLQPGPPLRLTVHDLRGRVVAERDLQQPGPESLRLDLRPGMYSVRLQQGGRSAHRKLILH
jgi:hypothetical protein